MLNSHFGSLFIYIFTSLIEYLGKLTLVYFQKIFRWYTKQITI